MHLMKHTTNDKTKNMEKMKFCQSCGMPLTDEVLGTNADGSKNEEYCMYCYNMNPKMMFMHMKAMTYMHMRKLLLLRKKLL